MSRVLTNIGELAVCPDRFQASIVARQARAFSGRCLDMTEFSQWGKLTDYPTTLNRYN